MDDGRTHRLNLMVSAGELEALRTEAKARGVTMAVVMREFIRELAAKQSEDAAKSRSRKGTKS